MILDLLRKTVRGKHIKNHSTALVERGSSVRHPNDSTRTVGMRLPHKSNLFEGSKRCILIEKHEHYTLEITALRNTIDTDRTPLCPTDRVASGRAKTSSHIARRAETSRHGSVGARTSGGDTGRR